MQLPPAVRRRIDERGEQSHFPALKGAASDLSESYRDGKPTRLPSDDHVTAYLATRMPATYAAARAVLAQLPALTIHSILDVGGGSGAASLAVAAAYPDASDFTLLERDPSLADAAREFLPSARVLAADVTTLRELPAHDLVIAAYSVGEIGVDFVEQLWGAARVALVVIEPGTPGSAQNVTAVRERLLALGACMAAPCPAAMPCPLRTPDWCHFAARVERSSLHRKLKGGDLGYEDEKFSYVAVTREPAGMAHARVLRHPRIQPGLIELQLCTAEGPHTQRVFKRQRDQFRAARRTFWGDAYSDGAK